MLGEDTLWLDISQQEASCVIRHTCRLRRILQSLPSPREQTPTLVLAFESPELRYFPAHDEDGVHLRLDDETKNDQHPLLIANTQSLLSQWYSRCLSSYEQSGGSFVREKSFPRQESISVLPRILLPFVDVLCFMCANQSDLRSIEAQINQWILAWRDAGTGNPMPGVIILLVELGQMKPLAVRRRLIERLPTAKISVVKMDESSWAVDGLRPIRKRLGQAASRARRWKANDRVLFSGSHMLGLFEESFDTTARRRPFHYVEASRSRHPVAPDLVHHLNNYVQTLHEGYDQDFAAESMASSFLLDHYTPGMHDFHIRDVFTALYQGACQQLSENVGFPCPSLVLHHMELLHAKFKRKGHSIVSVHQDTMNRHRAKWLNVEGSVDTCFVCLRRRPEYLLPCSHLLCLSCVKDFGDQCLQNPDRFTVRNCFLCGSACSVVVLDRPPTAGVGLLSLDGGGVRGIVQTEILHMLEERVGLPIPIQEHFQLAAGVSAGGLNLIALYLKGWRPSVCTRKYEEMAAVIFRKSLLTHIPVLSTVLSLWNRPLYSAETLEQVVEETYGNKDVILTPSYASSIGSRVILPAARSPHPSILLFTNYNGNSNNAKGKGYEVYGNSSNVAVSKIARSCTAAPTFFQPKFIPGVGWLQDAGMVENNPISLLLSQYFELYPTNDTCQFLLNIGSGSKSDDEQHSGQDQEGGGLGAVVDTCKTSALRRIASAYEWLLSGRSHWQKYTRSIDRVAELRERCIRLDISFQGTEPKLDDVQAMLTLKERVRNDASLSAALDSTVDRILASMFYLELEELPEQKGATLNGVGRILCVRKIGDPSLSLLVEKLVSWNARFAVNDKTVGGNMLSPQFWDRTGNFRLPTEFQVVGQKLSVSLTWPDGRAQPISGSPYNIKRLVDVQGLNAPFGIPDHRREHRCPRRLDTGRTQVNAEARKPTLKRGLAGGHGQQGGNKRRKLYW